ncbi:hypothetical protein [Acidipila sp. EB88]|uniref:hypothetical protein n=1 Tax=Acidipila sp. EB88 TaxID=2305226 RepID=UPI000F5F9D6D|nr:hypothetical protein [Acidipila sp. EB88]RRA50451.1 hypothetical protein D1Y84_00105 [Acidipila sp. EB88]
MKLSPKMKRNILLGGALFACASLPTFGLFGIGDIVFDPTSYASLVSQLTTLQQQYTTVKNNLTHFSAKSLWQTEKMQLENLNVASLFGETSGWGVALNTNNIGTSQSAWKMGTVAVNTPTNLAGQTPGASADLAQLAMVEVSDSVSPTCMTAIGQYNQQRTTNTTAQASLQLNQLDVTAATNSEVQQLNLVNAAMQQAATEAMAQGVIHSCVAAQLTIANMQQRNTAAQQLNDTTFVAAQRAANPSAPGGESTTWDSYLP